MSDYAGDVDCSATWEKLANNLNSVLVDVRTSAEWAFVGTPNLSAIQKATILIEWQEYPTMGLNQNFVSELTSRLEQSGGDSNTEIYFLCRSGARSRSAAIALTGAGYNHCYNVAGGFEGDHNEAGHRGQVNGWKAEGLPWQQK